MKGQKKISILKLKKKKTYCQNLFENILLTVRDLRHFSSWRWDRFQHSYNAQEALFSFLKPIHTLEVLCCILFLTTVWLHTTFLKIQTVVAQAEGVSLWLQRWQKLLIIPATTPGILRHVNASVNTCLKTHTVTWCY